VRSSEPRSDVIGTFARTDNLAGASFEFKPGGGALSLGLGYSFAFDFYDEGTGLKGADSYSHQPALDVKWKFFPKTAFVFAASADIRRYPNIQDPGTLPGVTPFTNSDLNAIRATVGLIGMLTSRLSVTLRAGYGDTLIMQTGRDNYRSVIGQAEFNYDLTMQTRFTLGYLRDFQPATLFGFYGFDRAYAGIKQGIAGKVFLSLNGAFEYQQFGTPIVTQYISTSRSDTFTTVNAAIDYEIQKWLSIGVSDGFQIRGSSFKDMGGAVSYTKNVALGKITFLY
jgi:hypothetical protein